MTRVAAFDCGTNSLRLLIADVAQGRLDDVERTLEIVRLGAGVDRTGLLDPEALARTLDVTRDYARRCQEAGVERMRFVATSATRDAANREDFLAGVREILGVTPEVVTGAEEARLSFLGAASVAEGRPEPVLVVDIGGGSTELVLGEGGAVVAQFSMDVGSVRMRERHLASDPPSEAELARARADVARHLDEALAVVPVGRTRTLVGLAGTVTSVTAEVLGLDSYDRERVNGTTERIDRVREVTGRLMRATTAERAALPHLHPGRVDVIGAGALVWDEVLGRITSEVIRAGGRLSTVTTSEHDILDGIALSLG